MTRWRARKPPLLQQQPSAGLARTSQPGRPGLVTLSPDITRVSLGSSKPSGSLSDYPPPSAGSELRLRASAGRETPSGARCAALKL